MLAVTTDKSHSSLHCPAINCQHTSTRLLPIRSLINKVSLNAKWFCQSPTLLYTRKRGLAQTVRGNYSDARIVSPCFAPTVAVSSRRHDHIWDTSCRKMHTGVRWDNVMMVFISLIKKHKRAYWSRRFCFLILFKADNKTVINYAFCCKVWRQSDKS